MLFRSDGDELTLLGHRPTTNGIVSVAVRPAKALGDALRFLGILQSSVIASILVDNAVGLVEL